MPSQVRHIFKSGFIIKLYANFIIQMHFLYYTGITLSVSETIRRTVGGTNDFHNFFTTL